MALYKFSTKCNVNGCTGHHIWLWLKSGYIFTLAARHEARFQHILIVQPYCSTVDSSNLDNLHLTFHLLNMSYLKHNTVLCCTVNSSIVMINMLSGRLMFIQYLCVSLLLTYLHHIYISWFNNIWPRLSQDLQFLVAFKKNQIGCNPSKNTRYQGILNRNYATVQIWTTR